MLTLYNMQNMNTVLEYYNGSVVNALVQLFPEINKKKLALSDSNYYILYLHKM